ncbi:hypothetical protein DW762_11275, partial [Ruminococcus sp. AM29-19LB]
PPIKSDLFMFLKILHETTLYCSRLVNIITNDTKKLLMAQETTLSSRAPAHQQLFISHYK